MPGIGSTGLYVDEKENEYAARVVGRSYKMGPVWRDASGAKIPAPTPSSPAPAGAIMKEEKIESGNFEIMATFRDGTEKLVSEVPADKLFEPDAAPDPAVTKPISTPAT
jgi:hypothetical protein